MLLKHAATSVIVRSTSILRMQNFKLLVNNAAVQRASLMTSSPSVNDEEIEKFDKIGKAWWDESNTDGVGPLHAMNPVRVKFIRHELTEKLGRRDADIEDHIKGLDILDVGCGGGLLSESLARLGANVTGIDPAPINIDVAEWHSKLDASTSSINYLNTTVEDMAVREKKFDVVCSLEVIEHVDDVPGFINSCFKCLKPNGSLFLSTLNRTPKAFLIAILGAEHLTRIVPVGTHDWKKFIKPDELKRLVERENGKIVTTRGMVLQPTFNPGRLLTEGCASWKLSRNDFDVNYIVHCMKK